MISVEEAQIEFKRLSDLMKEADRVRPRWDELRKFLEMAEHLSTTNGNDSKPNRLDPSTPEPASLVIARAAERALQDRPEGLRLRPLAESVKVLGWAGTGNLAKDMETIRKALRRRPQQFKNLGDNTWASNK